MNFDRIAKEKKENHSFRFRNVYTLGILLFILWSLIICSSLIWNNCHHNWSLEETLKNVAKSHFEKDVLYRRWNAINGGVYTTISEMTAPNPYLSTKERDITTPGGQKLTKINPAYMTRQVHELTKNKLNIQGHITSLTPIRPQNVAMPWEADALRSFERGAEQYSSITVIDGIECLRFMQPLITEKGCLKCHAVQGYQLGDVRGGISVTVPTESFRANYRGILRSIYVGHGIVWLIGTIGIFTSTAYRKKQQLIQRQYESFLREARESAESANAAKSEFLSNMSHEIRTPMNAVLGFAEVLKGKETDHQKLHWVELIHSSGKTLLTLINDVLDLSKVEAGKLELQYGAVSLDSLLDDLTLIFAKKAEDKGIYLKGNVSPDMPIAILDEMRLRQILINLIGNALKFTDHGFIRLDASCTFYDKTRSSMALTIQVQDSGIGIPKDQQGKIFESFGQTSGQKTAKYGGTGLGLSICQRLVELMGGTIRVDSEEGKGSTFIIELHDIEVASTEGLSEKSTSESIQFAPATVLLVDDIDYNRELLRINLEQWGLGILEATNGLEGVKLAHKHKPDLILMDMKMPVMDGYDATRTIKSDAELKDIPVIAVAAYAFAQDEAKISELCDSYMQKPISANNLARELCRFIPHHIIEEKDIPSADPVENSIEPLDSASPAIAGTEQPAQNVNPQGIHVLLAEDNEINQELTKEVLNSIGIQVTIARNGQEALERVQEQAFDLILMDLQMPVMDGLSATRAIRALNNPDLNTLPILAMSAGDWTEDKAECLAAGMNGNLKKPIDLENIITTLKPYFS
ncbi:response regulator [Verrucomicrobiota bacterium]